MSLRIYGASDDLIEVDGHFREEWSPPDAGGLLRLDGADGVCELRLRYTDHGTWSIEVVLVDEDAPLPWPVTLRAAVDQEPCYSVVAEIECGDDVTVTPMWSDA